MTDRDLPLSVPFRLAGVTSVELAVTCSVTYVILLSRERYRQEGSDVWSDEGKMQTGWRERYKKILKMMSHQRDTKNAFRRNHLFILQIFFPPRIICVCRERD